MQHFCAKCGSDQIRRNGHKQGHARYQCKAHERIRASALTELVVTDTIPLQQENHKIRVISVGDLFAHAIRNVVTHESISSLFV